jgi:hypothetical protein
VRWSPRPNSIRRLATHREITRVVHPAGVLGRLQGADRRPASRRFSATSVAFSPHAVRGAILPAARGAITALGHFMGTERRLMGPRSLGETRSRSEGWEYRGNQTNACLFRLYINTSYVICCSYFYNGFGADDLLGKPRILGAISP